MNQKRYSQASKVATLRILERNDYVFLRTEKLTGIRRQTIKVWAEIYGPDVFSGNSPLEQALELIEKELKQNDLKTINSCMSVMMVSLNRMMELAQSENNILKLAKALKLLSEICSQAEEKREHNIRQPDYTIAVS